MKRRMINFPVPSQRVLRKIANDPFTGKEAMAMQGLPLSRITFTRETQDELPQQAGNTMASTVICVVTLAKLIHGLSDQTIDPGLAG